MKRLLTYILFCLCLLPCSAQTLFEQANEQYASGNYKEAVLLYEQILNDSTTTLSNRSQANVLYNIGNAYFRQNELARSILCYERALRLDPQNKNARHNLAFAEEKIVDNIPDNSNFFLRQWVRQLIDLLPLRTWMIMSISLFVLSMVALLLFLFISKDVVRKIGFHTSWVALLLSVVTILFAANANRRSTDKSEAIVMQGVVEVRSSPDRSGTEIFSIHEGTKVHISDKVGEWIEIHVGDNIGWMKADYAEVI